MLTPEQSDQTKKGDAHRSRSAYIEKNITVIFSMTTKELNLLSAGQKGGWEKRERLCEPDIWYKVIW